jgi:uroporphyrinogen-III synthase
MPTQPIYLLATGPLPAELIEGAAEKGIVLDTMSFIATEAVADEEMNARIRALGGQRLTAVFTSTNAVEAIGRTGGWGWMIFCTSGATQQLVAERFGADAIAGTADSAAGLAAQIIRVAPAEVRRAAVYFFCGDQRRNELPDLLKEAGLTVHEVVVYRTLLTPQKTERSYAGIAFFSPSAVESYFSLNTVADDAMLFAIGRTTAAAIQARCSCPVIISDRPGKDALIHTMTDHFQTNNKE